MSLPTLFNIVTTNKHRTRLLTQSCSSIDRNLSLSITDERAQKRFIQHSFTQYIMENSICVYLSFGRCGKYQCLILTAYETHSVMKQVVRIMSINTHTFSVFWQILICQRNFIDLSPSNKILLSFSLDGNNWGSV